MAKRSLREILRDNSTAMDWKLTLKIGHSIALALTYLHCLKPAIIHRNLKPASLLPLPLPSSLPFSSSLYGI